MEVEPGLGRLTPHFAIVLSPLTKRMVVEEAFTATEHSIPGSFIVR